ncbi:Crp/Fnr family transcriptional regulator [Reichenbachiella sp. MSK19-1]|uniref:Crp/Fnr family transcriptional regulator n=1 Tax=Reichenbachiella sp. MSK19-1 TaxID=1897631 RepID=UPI000E6BAC53|nr:Crp/Fnr family transcriptional regulator [Reichenbachiella sp. MSK19-1]RJE70424.1 Crp/Fnr family transcriptional regulator [Reichenbachiella sp. MSK19-1]
MEQQLKKQIDRVVELTPEEFSVVLEHFTVKTFKKRQYVFRKGERVDYAYYVGQGLLKLIHTDDMAREYIVSFAMEDWWESDFMAYFDRGTASMSLKCLEETVVLCLSLDNYRKLRKEVPKMERFLLEKSNRGFIASQQRILSLMTLSAKERYDQLLAQYPSLLQRVSKTQLASYLGVSRETLSRLSS